VKINRALTFLSIITILLFFCGCSHDVSFYRKTGKFYYDKGAYEKAEAEYNKVLEHYPRDTDAHFRLGVIYHKMGVKYHNKELIEKSLLEFIEVTRIDPKYAKAFYNLGTIFSSRGPYFDAKKATFGFKKYLELEPATSHRDMIELWLSKYGTK